jgi:hypothetical protein
LIHLNLNFVKYVEIGPNSPINHRFLFSDTCKLQHDISFLLFVVSSNHPKSSVRFWSIQSNPQENRPARCHNQSNKVGIRSRKKPAMHPRPEPELHELAAMHCWPFAPPLHCSPLKLNHRSSPLPLLFYSTSTSCSII